MKFNERTEKISNKVKKYCNAKVIIIMLIIEQDQPSETEGMDEKSLRVKSFSESKSFVEIQMRRGK